MVYHAVDIIINNAYSFTKTVVVLQIGVSVLAYWLLQISQHQWYQNAHFVFFEKQPNENWKSENRLLMISTLFIILTGFTNIGNVKFNITKLLPFVDRLLFKLIMRRKINKLCSTISSKNTYLKCPSHLW